MAEPEMIKLSEGAMEQLSLLKEALSSRELTRLGVPGIPLGLLGVLRDDPRFAQLHHEIGDNSHRQHLLIDEFYGQRQHFEEEKQEKLKKYLVRTIYPDNDEDYWFLTYLDFLDVFTFKREQEGSPYEFDTLEEAEKWINPQTEIVEVDE